MRTLVAASVLLAFALAFAGCSSKDDDDGGSDPSASPAPSGTGAPSGSSGAPPTGAPTTSAAPTGPKTYTITLTGSTFTNGTFTARVGDTAHWVHADGTTAHTVTSDSDAFDSHPNCQSAAGIGVPTLCMEEGDTFDFKFEKAGTYAYKCKVHTSMTGTITVG